MYVGSVRFLWRKIPFFIAKIATLQKSIVPIGRGGFLVGVVVAGELAPPSTFSPEDICHLGDGDVGRGIQLVHDVPQPGDLEAVYH